MKGGNLYALARILGHASPKMKLDRYSHLSPEFIHEQRRIMDAPMYLREPEQRRKIFCCWPMRYI